jgi:hypothetical protein
MTRILTSRAGERYSDVSDRENLTAMDEQQARCVFCGRPVAGADVCPLLPSSHWSCCACEGAEAAGSDAA